VYSEGVPVGSYFRTSGHKYVVTKGSKRRAFKKFGVFDDDMDFAHRAVETCIRYGKRNTKCIVLVRDERILRFLRYFVLERFKTLKKNNLRIYVVKLPFSCDGYKLRNLALALTYYTDVEDLAEMVVDNYKWRLGDKIADIYTEITYVKPQDF